MTPDMFRKLAALGLSTDQMAGVLEIMEADAEVRKEKARSRVQKWREKQKGETQCNVTERNETSRDDLREGDARGVDNLLTSKITGKEESKKEAAPAALSDLAAFKADLLQDASAEQVEAFAKHRKAKKGQNSAYAAKLVRRDAEACSLSVSELIDMAISRGWLTVKPEYIAGRPQQRSGSPPLETVASFSRKELLEQRQNDDTDNSSGRVVQIDARRLENSPSGARAFAVSGNLLGSF